MATSQLPAGVNLPPAPNDEADLKTLIKWADDLIVSLTQILQNQNQFANDLFTALQNQAGFAFLNSALTVPFGYLLADGSAVSRTAYSILFSAIGTTYGVGDGSTTFNLPTQGNFPTTPNGQWIVKT